jgi:hypothetical protein
MKFQVGRFTCELSVNEGGTVLAKWLPETPKYLNKDERAQWQAGLTTFLNSLIKDDPQPDRRNNGSAARVKNLLCLIMAAGLLAGCARGGGIGLQAMVADYNCEQAGYQLGTPEYAQCRMALHQQSAINAAAMQAYYQRQQDYHMRELNRGQTCSYNGSTIGGMSRGTMTCQ